MIQIDLQSRVPLYEQLQEQIIRLSMLGMRRCRWQYMCCRT